MGGHGAAFLPKVKVVRQGASLIRRRQTERGTETHSYRHINAHRLLLVYTTLARCGFNCRQQTHTHAHTGQSGGGGGQRYRGLSWVVVSLSRCRIEFWT